MNRKRSAWRQGILFRAVRATFRLFYPARSAFELPAAPSVLVCRHKNLIGPVLSMLWLDGPVRPWVLGVFCERASCYRHFRDYTLTVRFGWPRALAVPCARALSLVVPALMRSMGAIGVERGSARSLLTLRETVRALAAGAHVILYPDVSYDLRSDRVGPLYDGYLLLSRLHMRETGRGLTFVPVAVSGRALVAGENILVDAREARELACERMRSTLAGLEAHNLEPTRILL